MWAQVEKPLLSLEVIEGDATDMETDSHGKTTLTDHVRILYCKHFQWDPLAWRRISTKDG